MNNIRLILLICLITASCSSTPENISPLPVSKEATFIENIEGKDDRFLAWGIGNSNTEAEIDALKAALYATMCGGGAGNAVAILTTSERMKNQDFIYSFFSNEEEWSKYVRSTNQGRIDPDKRIKLSNGSVKLGLDVVVSRSGLRDYLEYMNVVGDMRIGE